MMDILKKMLFSKRMLIVVMLGIFLYVGNLVLQEHVFTSGTWNYRMTVRIDTPEGIKTGSAVRMVWARHSIPIITNMNVGMGVKGEAVVVDLGERGKVFTLLDGSEDVVFRMFPMPNHPEGGGGLTKEGIRYYRNLKTGKRVLPIHLYPLIIRFKNLNDPQSIEAVLEMVKPPAPMPEEVRVKNNNFEKMFGKGVKLLDISIEMTPDPVTEQIETSLPWLFKLDGAKLGNDFFNKDKPDPEHYLTTWNFKR